MWCPVRNRAAGTRRHRSRRTTISPPETSPVFHSLKPPPPPLMQTDQKLTKKHQIRTRQHRKVAVDLRISRYPVYWVGASRRRRKTVSWGCKRHIRRVFWTRVWLPVRRILCCPGEFVEIFTEIENSSPWRKNFLSTATKLIQQKKTIFYFVK